MYKMNKNGWKKGERLILPIQLCSIWPMQRQENRIGFQFPLQNYTKQKSAIKDQLYNQLTKLKPNFRKHNTERLPLGS